MKFVPGFFVAVVMMCAGGCTSHSWTKIDRTYAVSYTEVFEKLPIEAKKCQMSLKSSQPEAGLIVLTAWRVHEVLTKSVFNMFAGDEVIVKVQQVTPTTTKVHIDSKARGQIGPDLGRTDRNVTALAEVLDKAWEQVTEGGEERGEQRPGTASQPSRIEPGRAG